MILLWPEPIVRRVFRSRNVRKEEVKEQIERINLFGTTPGIKTNFPKQSVPLQNNRSKNRQAEDKPVNSFQKTAKNDIFECKFSKWIWG